MQFFCSQVSITVSETCDKQRIRMKINHLSVCKILLAVLNDTRTYELWRKSQFCAELLQEKLQNSVTS